MINATAIINNTRISTASKNRQVAGKDILNKAINLGVVEDGEDGFVMEVGKFKFLVDFEVFEGEIEFISVGPYRKIGR